MQNSLMCSVWSDASLVVLGAESAQLFTGAEIASVLTWMLICLPFKKPLGCRRVAFYSMNCTLQNGVVQRPLNSGRDNDVRKARTLKSIELHLFVKVCQDGFR